MRVVDPIPELKRKAAARIASHIHDWSALDAGMRLDVSSRRVWDIRAGRLQRFSLEMLITFLTRLHRRVDLYVDSERL